MAAVFVLPSTASGQQGPVAALLSSAGWTAAARRVLGDAWLVTPDGVMEPADARSQGTAGHLASRSRSGLVSRVPDVAKTAIKDVRQISRARRFRVDPDGPWAGGPVDFVWQRHELFHQAGLDLAQALQVPSVLFVPATVIWEAQRWGVRRPGMDRMLERVGEAPALRRANLLACGAPEVAEQAVRMGADPQRIVITPTGVDLDVFQRPVQDTGRKESLGLGGRFVVGWVGSFRPFHAVNQLVEAVAGLDGVSLLLVGDGPERPAIEDEAAALGVDVVFTGTIDHQELPDLLAVMDAAAVLAQPDGGFHYSPLKLGEYFAAGLAVVAPDVPTVRSRVSDEVDVLLVPPGDRRGLRSAISRLRDDPDFRKSLGEQARVEASAHWSWDDQVRKVCEALR
ncbi:MAG: glycosyltransferase [Aquihabitans sp.]